MLGFLVTLLFSLALFCLIFVAVFVVEKRRSFLRKKDGVDGLKSMRQSAERKGRKGVGDCLYKIWPFSHFFFLYMKAFYLSYLYLRDNINQINHK